MYLPYAGIGSRETPKEILRLMFRLGEALANRGWTLRSGCAPGADSAFEGGAKLALVGDKSRLELFLPWPGFEERGNDGWDYVEQPFPRAHEIAAEFHPRWFQLSVPVCALMARNVHQILGPNLDEAELAKFVVCWTKDAVGGGGTGQALRIAEFYHVPIFDLARSEDRARIEMFVGRG